MERSGVIISEHENRALQCLCLGYIYKMTVNVLPAHNNLSFVIPMGIGIGGTEAHAPTPHTFFKFVCKVPFLQRL